MDGAYHDVDSSELAFKICAMAAFREAYLKAKPTAFRTYYEIGSVFVPKNFKEMSLETSTKEEE